jgi:hypothetical protein
MEAGMTNQKIAALIESAGKARVFKLESGGVIERDGGSVSWRNNNPGNLKFEFEGSADRTVHNHRSKEHALSRAQHSYDGIVGLDQWGNAVFETYEAGRAAKLQLLERMHGNKTVEAMLASYSTADYTGATHHKAQAEFIYREGDRQGFNLRDKTIALMSNAEREALADGIKGFEGWQPGTTRAVSSPALGSVASNRTDAALAVAEMNAPEAKNSPHARAHANAVHSDDVRGTQESLRRLGYRDPHGHPLTTDGAFGHNTEYAIKSFQRAHQLHVDGTVGKDTRAALVDAQYGPLLSEATHPAHPLYMQVLHGIQKLPHDTHRSAEEQRNLAVALTISAHVGGLKQIDHVVLGTNGVNLFAVQGAMEDPAHRRVHVDRVHAAAQTVEHGTLALQQGFLMQQQQPAHTHPLMQPVMEQRGVVMGIRP